MGSKYNISEIMETILAREIRNVVDEELERCMMENISSDMLIAMTFESIEDEEFYKLNFEEMINREI